MLEAQTTAIAILQNLLPGLPAQVKWSGALHDAGHVKAFSAPTRFFVPNLAICLRLDSIDDSTLWTGRVLLKVLLRQIVVLITFGVVRHCLELRGEIQGCNAVSQQRQGVQVQFHYLLL